MFFYCSSFSMHRIILRNKENKHVFLEAPPGFSNIFSQYLASRLDKLALYLFKIKAHSPLQVKQ